LSISALIDLKTTWLPRGSWGLGAMLGATRNSGERVFFPAVVFEFIAAT
jgi:hypothetical protein